MKNASNLRVLQNPIKFHEWWWSTTNEAFREDEYANMEYDTLNYLSEMLDLDYGLLEFKVIAEMFSNHYNSNIPIVQIKDDNIEMIIIVNEGWTISVNSKEPLLMDFRGICNTNQKIEDVNERFLKDKMFGTYSSNHSQFTFTNLVDLDAYVVFFNIFRKYFYIING